ncbi:metallophosphoesterase [Lysobacter koreensis]|uniref:Metallophosphoesterase n=1 Tax=Lysobacter koreensis TaxID=266122 RepID=A0ABW2YQJ2_9GAMM
MPLARWRRRIAGGVAVLAGTLLVLAGVALGPMNRVLRDRDRNVVLLAWDDQAARLVVNESVHAPLQLDGPYVRRLRPGYVEVMRVVRGGDGWDAERRLLHESAAVAVEVDNPPRTRFEVALRAPAVPPPDVVAQPASLLLLSDLDGDFDAWTGLLRAQGVIDDRLHWRFGAGHVAIAGDFMDEGPNILPLLWLLYRLQGEAEQAGGRVHLVLGNHELLLLAGRFRDAPQRLFASRDAFFDGDSRRMFAVDTVLGQWLRAQPVALKLGDTLLVHGGVSEVFLDAGLDLATANQLARAELDVDRSRVSAAAAPVLGRQGLPWYRGMAVPHDRGRSLEDAPCAHLDEVLRRYRVRRVAIGHTQAPRVMLEQQGRLLRLDVDHLRQGAQGASLAEGRWWRVDARGGREPLD